MKIVAEVWREISFGVKLVALAIAAVLAFSAWVGRNMPPPPLPEYATCRKDGRVTQAVVDRNSDGTVWAYRFTDRNGFKQELNRWDAQGWVCGK